MKQQLNEIKRLQELAGVAAEGERNSLKDDNVFDDIPSIDIDIQKDERGEDTLFMNISTLYHGGGNKKISLLKDNPRLQQQVMQVMQSEIQKTFRKVIHSILGEPYGLPESTETDIDLSDTPGFTSNPAKKIKNLPIPTLDSIAKRLSTIAKKRGCYDITKVTDPSTISNRDFSVYKYGAFSCDLSNAALLMLQDLKVLSDDEDSNNYRISRFCVYILIDRLKEEKLLFIEW
jgi:hypothetical protein